MASRRDQLQSHQFLTQRVISALVMRETDPAQSPLRRGIGAIFAGIMVSVMVAAGFGVYGLLTEVGGDAWKVNGAVVIEKDTGAAFVYQDGQLHPMLNYASALLATGSAPRSVHREPAGTLAAVPRGVTLGIPDAPNSLASADHTIGAPWTLCATGTTTTLALATSPRGGTPLAERGLLVGDATTRSTYLIWHGTRYAVAASVLPALFGVVTPVSTGSAWIDGIPQGPDIAPFTVPDQGSPSTAAPSYTVGDILSTQVGTGGVQYWMVLSGGLAPITELQKDIAVSQGATAPAQVPAATATSIHRTTLPDQDGAAALPGAPPKLAETAGTVCAVFHDTGAPDISIGDATPPAGTPTGSHTTSGAVLADRVAVPPGHTAVVRVMASATSAAAGYSVVTDVGIRYSVASDAVLAMLGYLPSDAVAMPAALVRLIPAGPALDPAAALRPAPGA